ncbi:zinc finger MYM-type protein 1-like [Zingiber officinale]|uniref:zinc finger MYM-type protein 1-like n=1 Tax=Zingiber officinale TaxID=94328 RepID=UPI001C4D3D6C|nr:zinc finger MYM-type protein 1-like [Zingiber officinale]
MEYQSATKKGKTLISSFFKKRDRETSESTSIPTTMENQSSEGLLIPSVQISSISSPSKDHQSSSACIERDPGKRKPICEYHVNIRDEIRRSYLKMGPYQPDMLEYPATKFGNQNRRFQKKWFQKFHWLEYSPSTNKAYCFYCFLFLNDINSSNISALVSEGFDNWKRVNQGKTCAFLAHIGSAASSPHTMSERRAENLMRPSQHIDNVMYVQAKEEKEKNRLRLKTSIVTVRWLALQGCAFRGNDESLSSSNRGNFLELVKAFAKMSTEINEVVLENAPKNAQYIAPEIQKDILHIMANRVRQMIREEVGDKFFCILVDEARDISKREQMAIILRFVNNHGILTERFFAIKSVSDTTSLNLKKEISNVLVHHDLQVKKLRGQGYDGASNMRGAWNGLQALFLRDCPYAYYVHCFAHRLQLTLVSATKDVSVIWEFFSHLDNIVNIVTSSTKRIAELHTAQRNEIKHMLAIGERDSGSGANQIGNLQRAGVTRWSSHYDSVKSLIGMYAATCKVFEVLSDYSPNGRAKAEVRGIYRNMASFEFVFILHLMHKIMITTDTLCQILQRKSQDILTAITFVSTTKTILQELRECGWEEFLHEVKVFCSRNDIDVPDLDCLYKIGRSRQQTTIEHHYHFDVFNVAIDFILMELNTRFNESSVELLSLSTALDPKNSFDSINSDDICKLAKKFYPEDFTNQDIVALEYELVHYKLDVMQNLKASTLVELCQQLTESGRSKVYIMLTRLIHLVLTLPVSTATTERAFSAMKHVKTALRNKMEDDFLEDCLTLYIERDLAKDIDIDSIIDEFYVSKSRRAQLC